VTGFLAFRLWMGCAGRAREGRFSVIHPGSPNQSTAAGLAVHGWEARKAASAAVIDLISNFPQPLLLLLF
jgi:hypothetical protein